MQNHILNAHKLLALLRDGTSMYESFICYVREEAKNGNLTLEQVGTSEEELAQLKVKGCKTAAHKWLVLLRDGNIQYESYIYYVREEAKNGKLTLEQVGTSEEELTSFKLIRA